MTFRLSEYTHRRQALDEFFGGSHTPVDCQSCHATVTTQFPAGRGTAIEFQTVRSCATCHEDTHRGSLGPRCEDCHRP
jgi:hypothetical protein